MERKTILTELTEQMKRTVVNNKADVKAKSKYDGNIEKMISTGSTLLDLAISGGRIS